VQPDSKAGHVQRQQLSQWIRRDVGPLALCALASVAAAVATGRPARAAYPERPIKIVAPFPPGASNDLTARIVGAALGDALGQPVVIENRPGANGGIGSAAVARAAPDGYTLLLVPNVFEVNALLLKQAAYDPIKDFAPIADIASIPNVIAANPATGLKTFADLMARSRARPDELNFSTPGVGSISHLGAELLKLRANLRMTHVPYSGVDQRPRQRDLS
jgi:tripartite-type tricarboxylate transporter receptor subunit TctC